MNVIHEIRKKEFGYSEPWFYQNPLSLRCELEGEDGTESAKRLSAIGTILFPDGPDFVFVDEYRYNYGSLMEVLCQLELSLDLGYLTNDEMKTFEGKIETIAKLISGLKKSIS